MVPLFLPQFLCSDVHGAYIISQTVPCVVSFSHYSVCHIASAIQDFVTVYVAVTPHAPSSFLKRKLSKLTGHA